MLRQIKFMFVSAVFLLLLLVGCQGIQPATETPQAPAPIGTQPATSDGIPTPVGSVPVVVTPSQDSIRPTQEPNCKTFSRTTYKVCDEFLSQWEMEGGLLRFGLPLSDWFYEVDEASGETYRVQYFERHIIKLLRAPHDSNMPRWGVAPKVPLGSIIYERRYPNGAPGQVPNKTGPAPVLMHIDKDIWLSGRFKEFGASDSRFMDAIEWFGTAISNEFIEKNEVDGKFYKVQYFERAALEYHPENLPPDDVQFAPLGLYEFRHRYPGGIPDNPTPTPRPYTTPEPGHGCLRQDELPPTKPTPTVGLAQAEAHVRDRYSRMNNGLQLGPLVISKYARVDITHLQSDVEIFRDAWHLGFRKDVATPTPLPTDVPPDMFDVLTPLATYNVYVDAETGEVLPGCEWDIIGSP